jgi:ABC-type Na+ efflux pump permease subunit
LAAVTPLAGLFLAATFLGAMFARSYRELTFVTVAVSTGLTAYAFVPAVFASFGSIGLISPLTLVVRDLQGTAITPLEFLFSTGPLAVTAIILFALGTSVYREEDMFTQRALSDKALDALARHVSGPRSVGVVVALAVPFVFVAELLTVALLVAIPIEVSVPVLIALIVVIEEAAKSLPIVAGYDHGRFPGGMRTAVALGAASGLGFFVAEKGTLAAQLVGLTELTQGQAAFGPGASLPLPTPVLLLLPLALHMTTAIVSSIGAERGDRAYFVALAGAILLHATYNLSLLVIGGVV